MQNLKTETPNNDSWQIRKLGDCFLEIINGTTINQNEDDGIPISRIETIQKSKFDLDRIKFVKNPPQPIIEKFKYKIGDLALSHINSLEHVGKVAVYDGTPKLFLHGMNLLRLRPNEEIIHSQYAYFYMLSHAFRSEVKKRVGKAVNQVSLNQHNLKEIPFLTPPIRIQKEMVRCLTKLLPIVEISATRLTKAKLQLKKFRQAILSAAITGKLTKDWREANKDIKPAAKLLERILAQRKAKSKAPTNNIENRDLPTIPEKWLYVFFGNIVDDFKYGTSEKSDYLYKGTPVLRIPNVISQKVNVDDLKYLPKKETKEEYLAKDGDVLIVRSNGSRDLVGKHALVNGLKGDFAFASYLIRIRPKAVLPFYMSLLLNSNFVRQQLFSNAKSAAGINNINTRELASMVVPLPPLEEQDEICEKVNQFFDVASYVEKQIENAETQVSKLTQAILAKTFRSN